MRWKASFFALPLSILFVVPRASFADELKLVSANGSPYDFDVTIGSTTIDGVDLSCLNDTREVTIGETWQVNATDLQGFTGTIDGSSYKSLDEDAYLDSLYNTNFDNANNSEVQAAIWDILDPSDYWGLNSTEKTLVGDAVTFAGLNAPSSSFYSQFTLFTPTSDRQGWTAGEPQQFLEYTPSQQNDVPPPGVTPEPTSLMLLGTGLFSLVGVMRLKTRSAAAHL